MNNKITLVGIILLLSSCFAKKQNSTSTINVLVPKKEINSNTSSDSLKRDVNKVDVKRPISPLVNNAERILGQGKALYQTKCNQCHDLKNEKSESEKGWNYHVPEMVEMSNKAGKPISQSESNLILGYLLNAIKG